MSERPNIVYTFHVAAHVLPATASAGLALKCGLLEIETLTFKRSALGAPFSVSFEQAVERLVKLPRMDVEPDGFFVWSGELDGMRWQVDGHLYDRADRLLMVTLKGSCPVEQFEGMLLCIGWPETPLMFELVQQDAYVGEAEFRRLAAQ